MDEVEGGTQLEVTCLPSANESHTSPMQLLSENMESGFTASLAIAARRDGVSNTRFAARVVSGSV